MGPRWVLRGGTQPSGLGAPARRIRLRAARNPEASSCKRPAPTARPLVARKFFPGAGQTYPDYEERARKLPQVALENRRSARRLHAVAGSASPNLARRGAELQA